MYSIQNLLPLLPGLKAIKLSSQAAPKYKKAVSLLHESQNPSKCKGALQLLDSIGVGSNPSYGEEGLCAAIYYLKANFYVTLNDTSMAEYCLKVVDKVPLWRVFFGRKTIKDIKEEARKLAFKLK